MEKSALVYIVLTARYGGHSAFCVRNQRLYGRIPVGQTRLSWSTSGDLMAAGPDRQQAWNAGGGDSPSSASWPGVSACRIAVGGDYWVYWLKFQLIDQGRHVSYETGFVGAGEAVPSGSSARAPICRSSASFRWSRCSFFLKALHDQADWYVVSLFCYC